MYYPVAWLDESTNTTYQNGYYDEQGNRYDNLILKNNEKYENVPMHCEYCETTQVRDLTDDNETMTCPHCGANMVIDAILDERTDIPSYDQTVSYNSTGTVSQKGKWRPFIIVAIVIGAIYIVPAITSAMFAPFYGLLKFVSNIRNPQTGTVQQTSQQTITTQTYEPDPEYLSNEDIFGMVLYLKSSEEGMLFGNSTDYEKNLIWNDSDECYYDASSDCYVWFNTDLDPSLWQYWYEGISSDYGDYGWMEYEDGKWYIETDYGNWEEIDLSGYGDRIWHFADAYASDYWEN